MLRTIFISGLATALLGGAALAADLPTRKTAPVIAPPPPAISWTGFYIGVNGGYAGDEFKYPASAAFSTGGPVLASASASADLTSSGFLGGLQAGYNWQFAAAWLAGVEADIDATSITGKVSLGAGGSIVGLGSASASAAVKSETPYLGTVRGRLGYLVTDRFLVFATGGLAYGQIKTSADVGYSYLPAGGGAGGSGAFAWSKDTTHTGWTVGGGAEYKINKNVSFKTEYLYVDLGEQTLVNGSAGVFGGALVYNLKVHPTDNIVRAGLNYTFD